MPKRTPPDWTPPYPTWGGTYLDQRSHLVLAYFAVQFGESEGAAVPFRAWWQAAAQAPFGPAHAETAFFVDKLGANNVVALAYWRDKSAYDRWWQQSAVSSWWTAAARETGPVGYWREIHVVAPTHFETAFATKNPDGLGHVADGFGEELKEHAYWGSMRDRIPAAAGDELAAQLERPLVAAVKSALGRRVTVRVPNNITMIRSGQDWTDCEPRELTYYHDKVHPVLIKGMNFLRDNPAETGCLSCRLMTSEHPDETPRKATFATVHFACLEDLELWAEHHPTHLAIFGSFLTMVKDLDGQLRSKFWHEVIVLDGSQCEFEYINCNTASGSLPYLREAPLGKP